MRKYIFIFILLLSQVFAEPCEEFMHAFKNKDHKGCMRAIDDNFANRLWEDSRGQLMKKFSQFMKKNYSISFEKISSFSQGMLHYNIIKETIAAGDDSIDRQMLYVTKNKGGIDKIVSRVRLRGNPMAENSEVKFDELGFAFTVPKDYVSIPLFCKQFFMRQVMLANSENSCISVTAIQLPYPLNPETIAASDRDVLKRQTRGFREIGSDTLNVSGLPAAWYSVEFEFDSEKRKRKAYYIKQGRTVYAVMADSAEETASLYSALDKVVFSIRFYKPGISEQEGIAIHGDLLQVKNLKISVPDKYSVRPVPSHGFAQCFIEPEQGKSVIQILAEPKKMSVIKTLEADIAVIKKAARNFKLILSKSYQQDDITVYLTKTSYYIEALGQVERTTAYFSHEATVYKIVCDSIGENNDIETVFENITKKMIIQ